MFLWKNEGAESLDDKSSRLIKVGAAGARVDVVVGGAAIVVAFMAETCLESVPRDQRPFQRGSFSLQSRRVYAR